MIISELFGAFEVVVRVKTVISWHFNIFEKIFSHSWNVFLMWSLWIKECNFIQFLYGLIL